MTLTDQPPVVLDQLPAPNIPLLRKAVEWAEAEAAKTDGSCLWNQGVYAVPTGCGTAFCIAGWTVATAHPDAKIIGLDTIVMPNGKGVAWEHEAQQLLGITEQEGYDLFDPENDIGTVRELAEHIAARAGERL